MAATGEPARGRRDFSSDARMVPGRYDVVVAAEHAAEARRTADLPMQPDSEQREAGALT